MSKPNSQNTRKSDEDSVETLLSLKGDKYEIWKYYEDRADRLSERLWSTGTWLISILAAIISLPFIAKFILVQTPGFPIRVESSVGVILIALFGIAFCLYSYFSLIDMKEHIIRNWRRANLVRTDTWNEDSIKGRKKSGWNIIFIVGVGSLIVFISFLLLAILN